MLKVWGRINSVNVQKVLWCCDELDIPFQWIDAGTNAADLNTSTYRKLNPNALIPSVEDGELVLWESNAILRYLSASYGEGKLWPQDPGQRSLADRWMDWQLGTFWVRMRPLFMQLIRTPTEQRDSLVIQKAFDETSSSLTVLNEHLSGNEYVVGNEFSIGDIPVGAVTQRWMSLPIDRPDLPHLQAWYDRLCQREAFQERVMMPLS